MFYLMFDRYPAYAPEYAYPQASLFFELKLIMDLKMFSEYFEIEIV